MFGLPYERIIAIDFEFLAFGDKPTVVCMVARDLISGQTWRKWGDELGPRPPFPVDESTLMIAYMISAELGCFLSLGWPLPTRIIDLYGEFRHQTNGLRANTHPGLLDALREYHIPGITKGEKQAGRDAVMAGPPWSDDRRRLILEYCETDVTPLPALFERLLVRIQATELGEAQALLRGRYCAAVARMEHYGVPIDVPTLQALRAGWESIKLDLIEAVDCEYGVYEGSTFKSGLFAAWLADRNISWPLTPTGRLATDEDTFKDMAKAHPELQPLRELRVTLGQMRLEKLQVGSDGRNRAMISPFGARTSRNTPSSNEFIFGPSVWIRSLIKPGPGQGLAYLDWSSQEVAIAAHLSGDERLLEAVQDGDPYLEFATAANLVPAGATKRTHPAEREVCKTCVLGTQYGMGARS